MIFITKKMSTVLEDRLKIIQDDIKTLNEKLDLILVLLDKDINENCKKKWGTTLTLLKRCTKM